MASESNWDCSDSAIDFKLRIGEELPKMLNEGVGVTLRRLRIFGLI